MLQSAWWQKEVCIATWRQYSNGVSLDKLDEGRLWKNNLAASTGHDNKCQFFREKRNGLACPNTKKLFRANCKGIVKYTKHAVVYHI